MCVRACVAVRVCAWECVSGQDAVTATYHFRDLSWCRARQAGRHGAWTPVDEPGHCREDKTIALMSGHGEHDQCMRLQIDRRGHGGVVSGWGNLRPDARLQPATHPKMGRSYWSRWQDEAKARVLDPVLAQALTLRAVT